MVMESNYFSPLVTADYYILFIISNSIHYYWRRYRSSLFQQKYTSSFSNPLLVLKSFFFF